MANEHMSEDEKVLHGMGYAQELHRRMGGFQNFAISFSIICILSGGFGSFPIALSTGGTFSLRRLTLLRHTCSTASFSADDCRRFTQAIVSRRWAAMPWRISRSSRFTSHSELC